MLPSQPEQGESIGWCSQALGNQWNWLLLGTYGPQLILRDHAFSFPVFYSVNIYFFFNINSITTKIILIEQMHPSYSSTFFQKLLERIVKIPCKRKYQVLENSEDYWDSFVFRERVAR